MHRFDKRAPLYQMAFVSFFFMNSFHALQLLTQKLETFHSGVNGHSKTIRLAVSYPPRASCFRLLSVWLDSAKWLALWKLHMDLVEQICLWPRVV